MSSDKISIAKHQINAEYASGIRRGPRATNRGNRVLHRAQQFSLAIFLLIVYYN